MVFGFLIGAVLHAFGLLPPEAAKLAASLWYLAVIVPALGSGLVITIHSWIVAYRERDLLSMGTAAWNTFAQIHNTMGAIDGIGEALGNVVSGFSGDDDEDSSPAVMLAIVVVAAALLSGVLLTWALIQKYAGRLPLPEARAAA